MEGLHHDTILDSDKDVTKTEDSKPMEEDNAPNAKSNVFEKDFSQSSANISLSKEEKFSCSNKWLEYEGLRKGLLDLINKATLGAFYICTLGKKQLLLAQSL